MGEKAQTSVLLTQESHWCWSGVGAWVPALPAGRKMFCVHLGPWCSLDGGGVRKNCGMHCLLGSKFSFSLRLSWWLRQQSVCLQCGRPGFNPWVRKISWRRKWQPIPVFLPEESHGERSLAGYSPWGCKEWDMTEWLHFPFPFLLFSCKLTVEVK